MSWLMIATTGVEALDNNAMSTWTGIEQLDIFFNRELKRIGQKAFVGLRSLKSLDLDYNYNLNTFHPDAFEGLNNLRVLHLRNTGIVPLLEFTTAVSRLPNLEILNMTSSIIEEIGPIHFQPLSNSRLKKLFVCNTRLTRIHPSAFSHMKHLETLSLTSNNIDESTCLRLVHALNSSVSNLEIASNNLIPQRLLQALMNKPLIRLDLTGQKLGNLDIGILPPAENLESLHLENVGMNYLKPGVLNGSLFPRLRTLSLARNSFQSLLDTMVWPQLETLNVSHNVKFVHIYGKLFDLNIEMNSFENLISLDVSHNNIGTINNRALRNMRSLKKLYLRASWITYIEQGAFAENVNLVYLDLSENNFIITDNSCSEIFKGLINLQYLDLSNLLNSDYNANIFSQLKNLKYLSLRQNMISKFSPGTFSNVSLVQLDFRRNNILAWSEPLFMKIKNILLAENRINFITPAMVNDFRHSSVVELSSNPIECDCFLYGQLREAKGAILHRNNKCFIPTEMYNVPLKQFLATAEWNCNQDLRVFRYFGYFIILIFAVVFIYWCFSFEIASLWYDLKSRTGYLELLPREVDSDSRDAFVSYSHTDAEFVRKMSAILERHMGISLIISERDFLPGELITDCVLQALNLSECFLIILSNNFLQSSWCVWEMAMAEELSDKRLIFIQISELDPQLVTEKITYVISRGVLFRWKTALRGQRLFWARLCRLIKSSRKT